MKNNFVPNTHSIFLSCNHWMYDQKLLLLKTMMSCLVIHMSDLNLLYDSNRISCLAAYFKYFWGFVPLGFLFALQFTPQKQCYLYYLYNGYFSLKIHNNIHEGLHFYDPNIRLVNTMDQNM